ncbi:hypothetical protein LXA43DRAFT_1091893 [Ganoderma leucocontextum]|nr:hypothetical protein LXA43DRAFT_1091893 [Ganoderma leucocontextum]
MTTPIPFPPALPLLGHVTQIDKEVPLRTTAKVRDMFDDMVDISQQMIQKWERFGPRHVIGTVEDFTRLAFDTITLCAMSYHLNNFYEW